MLIYIFSLQIIKKKTTSRFGVYWYTDFMLRMKSAVSLENFCVDISSTAVDTFEKVSLNCLIGVVYGTIRFE